MRAAEIAGGLDGAKRAGEGWSVRCPCHDDQHASLSLRDGDGGVLVTCHAGCERRDVIDVLKARGLWPQSIDGNGAGRARSSTRNVEATYDYRDENGAMLFQVVRYEPKEFRQRRPDGQGGWIHNLQGVRRLLYRSDELAEADPDRWVLVVEGEKDADRLVREGILATTSPGGAGKNKWRNEYSEQLSNRRIAILPDNDKPGLDHAVRVAAALHDIAADVRVITLGGLPEKGDVSDWLATGHSGDELLDLVGRTPMWSPTADDSIQRAINEVPTYKELEITDEELESARLTPTCIVENHTYADVAVISAPGGTGKTTILLYEHVCIALARPVWGLRVNKPGWTLIVTAEDQRERLVARLRHVMDAMELDDAERSEAVLAIRIWDVTGEQRKLATVCDGNVIVTGLADLIADRFADTPPVAILFDPLVSFGADEERINTNEQAIVTALRRLVKRLDCCVRVVHHTGQAAARDRTLDQYAGRGGSAMADGARMVSVMQTWTKDSKHRPPLGLHPEPGSSISILARPKLSYSPPGLPHIWIKRTGFAFEHVIEQPTSIEQREAARTDQLERFLASELKQGKRYTKTELESVRETKIDMTRGGLRGAVVELTASGRIINVELPSHLRQGGRRTFLCPVDLKAEYGGVGTDTPE
jgi:RecA-family ATPase